MTYEMMVETVRALGEDAFLYERGTELRVDLVDFIGFDEDWNEIYREYDHPEEVEEFEEMLERECLSQEGDFYTTYYFDGFSVTLGYSSYDI